MSLNVETLAEITFRQTDTPQQRVSKLEYLKSWIIEQTSELSETVESIVNNVPDHMHPISDIIGLETELAPGRYERVRAWWEAAPAANQTLIIWPFGQTMTIPGDFNQAVGFLGGSVGAERVIEVYQNPTFTGTAITGGDLIGTITIDTGGTFNFQTVDGLNYIFDPGDTLAAKWPSTGDAAAAAGAFVLYALYGEFETFGLLIPGGSDLLYYAGGDDDALLVP